MIGGSARFGGVVGTSLVKVFDLHVGRTGVTETEARRLGMRVASTTITADDIAHYYPGSSTTTVKIVADATTSRLLGAQIVGRAGVPGRTNVVATALQAGMTVGDLADLDLGYAPPFAPVWDPLLVAANRLGSMTTERYAVMDLTTGSGDGALDHRPEPNFDVLTPLSFLDRSSRVHASRIAVVDGDAQYTYAEWHRRAMGLAGQLRSLDIEPGDRVAVMAGNSEPMLLAHFAVPMAGADLVAINTRLSPREVDYILEHSGARVALVSPELSDSLVARPGLSRVVLDADFVGGLDRGSEAYAGWHVEDERQSISVNYTSGTTGRPKGVVYHHRGAYLNALAMALDHGLTADSTYLWTLPMFHCNGWCYPWATVAVGARNYCLPRIDPEQIWDLCSSGEVTHLCAAPTVLTMLAESASATAIGNPVRIVTAGAPPSPTIIERMEDFGFVVDHVYGLTETYGPFTVNVTQRRATPPRTSAVTGCARDRVSPMSRRASSRCERTTELRSPPTVRPWVRCACEATP